MHILLASALPWDIPDDLFTPWASKLTRIHTGADGLVEQVEQLQPNLVFLGDLPQHDAITAILDIRAHAPHIIVIPYIASPAPDFLLQLMRIGINDVLTDTSAEAIGEVIERVSIDPTKAAAPGAKTVRRHGFIAAKGGAGATLLLANFGVALAKAGNARVLLVDLSLPFGDLDIYLTAQPIAHDLADLVEEVDRLDQGLFKAMVHHLNDRVDVIPCPQTFERVIRVTAPNVARLMDQVAPYYDYVLFDLGSSIDPVKLGIIETLDQLAIVATLDVPSARRTSQMFTLLQHLDFSPGKTSLVINRQTSRTSISIPEMEKAVGKKVSQTLPETASGVADALAQGAPLIETQPHSPFAHEIDDWVASILRTPRKGKSLWQRLRSK
jgi:pilus assembly protein CpaE